MMRGTRRAVAWAITGGVVGLLQGSLAFLCAGAGHGTIIPLIVSASPLSLVPFVGLLGVPILWGTFAVLATAAPTRRNKLLFIGLMLSHYLVAAALVCWTPAGDWDYVAKTREAVPGFLDGWVVSYGAAHLLAWWLFLGGSGAAAWKSGRRESHGASSESTCLKMPGRP